MPNPEAAVVKRLIQKQIPKNDFDSIAFGLYET